MNNFDTARKVVQTSLGAEGSAVKENEKYLESVEGKITEMKSQFQVLSSVVMNSDVLKFFIDIATGAEKALASVAKFSNIFGKFGSVVAGLGAAKGLKSILSAVQTLTKAGQNVTIGNIFGQLVTGAGGGLSGLAGNLGSITKAFSSASGAAGLFKTAMSGIGSVIAAHPILAAVAAIYALGKAIQYVASSGERADQAVEDSMSAYTNAKTDLESVNSELESAKSQIDELQAKGSLTFVEEAELQKLKDTVEQLTIASDLQKKEVQESAKDAAKSAVKAFNKNFGGEGVSSEDVDSRLKYYKEQDKLGSFDGRAVARQDLDAANDNLSQKVAALKYSQGLMNAAKEEMNKAASEVKKESSDTSSKAYKNAEKAYEDAATQYQNYKDIVDEGSSSLFTDQVAQLQEYKDAINSVTESGGTLSKSQQDALDTIDSMIEYVYKEFDPDTYKQMQFDELFSSESLSKAKDALVDLAKESNNVGITVDDLKSKYPELAKAIEGTDFSLQDVVDQINAEAGVLNLDEVKSQLKEAFTPEVDSADMQVLSKQWNDWVSSLSDDEIELLYSIKQSNDTSGWSIDEWKDALESAAGSAQETIDHSVEGMTSVLENALTYQEAFTEAVDASNSTTGLTVDQINNLVDSYSDLTNTSDKASVRQKILNDCFTTTESGLRANLQNLEAYNKALEANKKLEFAKAIKEASDALQEAQNNSATPETIENLQNELTQLQLLSAEYDGTTSKFQKWVDAQSSANAGDNYRSIYDESTSEGMLASAKKLYDAGRTNTDDFRTAAQYYSYEDLAGASQEKIVEAWEKSSEARDKYFTGTKTGIDNFMEALTDATDEAGNSMGWAELDESGKMNFAGKLDDIADYFGISSNAIYDILSAASEYSDSIDLSDLNEELKSATENTTSFAKETSEAQAELLSAYGAATEYADSAKEIANSTASVNFVNPDFDVETASLDEIQTEIERLNGLRADIEVDANTDEGKAQLEAFDSYLESLNNQAVAIAIQAKLESGFTVDELLADDNLSATLQIDDSQVATAKAQLESLKGENVEAAVSVKIDETQFAQLTGTKDMTVEVTPRVTETPTVPPGEMDVTANVTSTSPSPLTGNMDVTANVTNEPTINGVVNFTAGEQPETVNDATGIANYTLGESPKKVPDASGIANYSLGRAPTTAPTIYGIAKYSISMGTSTAPTIYGTAVYTKKVVSTGTMTSARADGTAYNVKNYRRLTPSYAGGKVSLDHSEKALVNELGTESIIRNGVWSLIPGKMHIQDLKKGDIILNAKQTKDLLTHGTTNSNARSYAYGTLGVSPYVSGSWTFGGGDSKYTGKYSSSSSSKSSSSSSGGTTYNYNTYNNYSSGSSSSNGSSSSSSSSSSSGSSDSGDDSEPKVIDWIEVAIDRIERAIDNLSTIATSSFRKLSEKLTATNDELSKTSDEISLQQSAYTRYVQQADSVGLSSDLAERVKNGTIDINEYDEDTADKIEDYQEWYEKALDCNDAILELTESLGELYQNKFDDVQTDYENQLSLLEHLTNTYNNGIDDLEERGYLASTKYYDALKKIEQKNISVHKKELEDLTVAMSEAVNSGSIAEGSEAWYEFQKNINEVKEAIQESETALVEFSNSIREIKWDRFDYLQEQISNITEEADFLIDLMDHSDLFTDNGQFTDVGTATLGLHGQNYNVYMAQADKYAKELLSINKEIAKDPYNTTLLDRREELLESQRDAILAAEDEKDAIVDLVKEGIELELDALQDLIDKYTDSMDSAKDLYDYQKKVAEQAETITSIEKQLSAYEGDTSEEARATIQQLKVDLKDAQSDLEDTQYDRQISETKSMLNNLYDEYELILNERLDNVDTLMAEMISTINAQASSINNTLLTQANNVGYTITENTKAIWAKNGNGYAVISQYGESFLTKLTTVNDVLSKIAIKIGAMTAASEQKASTTVKNTKKSTATNKSVKPQTSTSSNNNKNTTSLTDATIQGIASAIYCWGGSKSGWGDDPDRKQRFTEKFGADNAKKIQDYINAHYNDNSLYDYWVRSGYSSLSQFYYSAFKNGGLADYTGVAWLDGTPNKPEMVLNASDTSNFIALKDAMKDIASGNGLLSDLFNGMGSSSILSRLIGTNSLQPTTAQSAIGDITYQVNIPIDHVQDYDDFMNQMRADGKFEKMIQSMTVERLSGASQLSKNKYKW